METNSATLKSLARNKANLLLATAATTALCLSATSASGTTILQYGYDFTTGDVVSQGNLVNDDSGSGNNASAKVTTGFPNHGGGNGGTYSADIPNAAFLQNTTGIGSVDTSLGTHTTTTTNVLTNATILGAGGLTMQAWIKPNADAGTLVNGKTGPSAGLSEIIISESGAFGISVGTGTANDGFVRVGAQAGGSTGAVNNQYYDVPELEWSHVAVTFSNVSQNGNSLNATLTTYINGELQGSATTTTLKTGFDFSPPSGLNRGIAIANHPTTLAWNFQGLIYEPVVSLGVLETSEFTYVPEPGSLALLAVGALTMMRRRRG